MMDGYAQTIVNTMVFEACQVCFLFSFSLFLGLFWRSFSPILVPRGPHFCSHKVNAIFDRKSGQVNPLIPGNPDKSRDRGSRALKELSIRPYLDSKAPGGTPHRDRGTVADSRGQQLVVRNVLNIPSDWRLA